MSILDVEFVIGGNLAKVRVLQELDLLIEQGAREILDVGCAGLQPLQFWEPLLETRASDFDLYGVDVAGVAKAEELARTRNWKNVNLQTGSGYYLDQLFEEARFDVVVATQVLEHIAQMGLFLDQLRRVVRPGGYLFLTFDSAHRHGKYDWRHPVELLKTVVKIVLSWLGNESHYNLSVYDFEAERLFAARSLRVLDKRFYNVHPLKRFHNHLIADDRKNDFLRLWLALEDFLNQDQAFINMAKPYFLGLYYKLQGVD